MKRDIPQYVFPDPSHRRSRAARASSQGGAYLAPKKTYIREELALPCRVLMSAGEWQGDYAKSPSLRQKKLAELAPEPQEQTRRDYEMGRIPLAPGGSWGPER